MVPAPMVEAAARAQPPQRSAWSFGATGRWALLGVLVGICAGIGAVLFHYGLHWTTEQVLVGLAGYDPQEPAGERIPRVDLPAVSRWLIVVIPAIGGLVAGLLIAWFCPDAAGEGTNGMIRSFHRQGGRISLRVLWVKLVASIATIGSGGSAGREGPSTQIGGAIGSSIAGLFRLRERDRRILLLAGASAGVGAIFRAPLGGALFAGEVLYRDTDSEAEALIPCLVASIVAYSVFILFLGNASMFSVPPEVRFQDPLDLVWYGLLGVLCAVFGRVYVGTLRTAATKFAPLPLPRWAKPALGGALVGLLALLVGELTGDIHQNVLGGGHGLIQIAMDGLLPLQALAVLLVGKMLATSLTVGSGGSGGLFAPSLVVGALLGGVTGEVLRLLELTDAVAPFVLVGMGGFFAGVGKVPITAVIMVSEITKSYELLAPIMLAASVAFLLSRSWTLFEEQVATRLDSPAHAGDFVVDVLEQLSVRDVIDRSFEPTLVRDDTPLRRVLALVAQSDSRYFPVVDGQGRMTGIFSLTDIRRVMTETALADLVLAREIATEDVLKVTPDDDLNTALKRFTIKNIDELPVVATDDPTRVLGMLSRKDVIRAYGDRLRQLRQPEADGQR